MDLFRISLPDRSWEEGSDNRAEESERINHGTSREDFLRMIGISPAMIRQPNLTSAFYHGSTPKADGASASRLAIGAMRVFKKWLVENQGLESSENVEQISPEVLDPYLAQFLTVVRKQDGSDYRPNSLRSLRQGIDFYLKDHGYPYSVINCRDFPQAYQAYRKRVRDLNAKSSETSDLEGSATFQKPA